MNGRIVVVSWIDSSLQNVQVDRDDFPKPTLITSVGLLVEQRVEYVTLARDDMGDGDYRGLVCIPRECIQGMTVASKFRRPQAAPKGERLWVPALKREAAQTTGETGC